MTDILFYDGHCGLCHRWVRFVLAVDREARFEFAPLQGATFREKIPREKASGLPDSIVLVKADGELLVKSRAVFHVLRSLGGGWRVLAAALGWLPGGLCDGVYDGVARARGRLFPRPEGVCPLVAPPLRARFRD
jgi:predicted DCC family thiol-disulfide oxidoreductase YuxK